MPFALLLFGVVLVVAGVRGKQGDLFTLLKGDFTGPNNFSYWVVAILLLGLLGYVPKLKALANAFMGLLILVLFLNNSSSGGGFFAKFTAALQSTNTVTATKATP